MKKRKKKTITRSVLILIIITAVITALVGQVKVGLISPLWKFAWQQVWPPRLEAFVTEFIIYRTSFDEFPTCEMNVIVNNATDRSITMELKSLRLFREDIAYRFPAGEQLIKVEPNHRLAKSVAFRDKVLDTALRVPQDSATAMLHLEYEYVGRESHERLVLRDADVIKCTYWQVPTFDTEAQALATGAEAFWLEPTAYWTDSTGASRCTTMKFTTFTTKTGLHDFDMTGLKNFTIDRSRTDFSMLRCPVPFVISSAFRRRYGGVYSGHLICDSVEITPFRYANEFLTQDGDYDQYSLMGITYDRDFREILEFIHYTFDRTKQDQAFRFHQDNSKFYILLVHENPDGISEIADSLKGWGYRAGFVKAQGLAGFLQALALMPPDEKLPALLEKLNMYVESLNFVTHNNGIFLFLPAVIESTAVTRIVCDLRRAAGKSTAVPFNFDCRPFKSHLIAAAPFSTPVLAFLNFSQETRRTTIDTLGLAVFRHAP